MYIPVILGTARKGRQSEKVARFILAEVKKAGLETELLDVRDYRLEATDNTGEPRQAKKLAGKISPADALIIEQLRQVVAEFSLVPIHSVLYFPNVQDCFNESGEVKDAAYYKRVKAFLDELVSYAKLLKAGKG